MPIDAINPKDTIQDPSANAFARPQLPSTGSFSGNVLATILNEARGRNDNQRYMEAISANNTQRSNLADIINRREHERAVRGQNLDYLGTTKDRVPQANVVSDYGLLEDSGGVAEYDRTHEMSQLAKIAKSQAEAEHEAGKGAEAFSKSRAYDEGRLPANNTNYFVQDRAQRAQQVSNQEQQIAPNVQPPSQVGESYTYVTPEGRNITTAIEEFTLDDGTKLLGYIDENGQKMVFTE